MPAPEEISDGAPLATAPLPKAKRRSGGVDLQAMPWLAAGKKLFKPSPMPAALEAEPACTPA